MDTKIYCIFVFLILFVQKKGIFILKITFKKWQLIERIRNNFYMGVEEQEAAYILMFTEMLFTKIIFLIFAFFGEPNHKIQCLLKASYTNKRKINFQAYSNVQNSIFQFLIPPQNPCAPTFFDLIHRIHAENRLFLINKDRK